ncbi:LacI family DNA-binding transcriptional regulator [Pseudarthrobacter equi]|nr:LacI family DNA-binding transcriptional regulator [Pseudarthrobacter equi]
MDKEGTGLQDRVVTIGDIARRAGVAASTVSRALSNPDRVNAGTREKIEQIAAELGYVPSAMARNLRMGKTGTIAVLVPDVSNPFSFEIVRGTQTQIRAEGYSQVLINTEQAKDFELDVMRQLRRSADGVVLGSSMLTDEQLAELSSLQPLVTINRPTADAPTVLIDSATAMTAAVNFLADLGHSSVTYVSGPEHSWSNRQRWEAVEKAAAVKNMRVTRTSPYPADKVSGAAAADEALATGSTSVIAFNDMLAIGMLQRMRELGVAVPGGISIIGCDDVLGADFCNPPLTTVASPIEQAGQVAVSMLLSRLNPTAKAMANPFVLPSQLVVRASTGPAPKSLARGRVS